MADIRSIKRESANGVEAERALDVGNGFHDVAVVRERERERDEPVGGGESSCGVNLRGGGWVCVLNAMSSLKNLSDFP
ncbi:hypothetical protein Syun_023525 [Stephania yunnanensis]|uniref:Uncharacterized protein n=1 Tax=Stephania yunnanensis TaxID=152371 RepID=A0AAP0FPB4_9MAGN